MHKTLALLASLSFACGAPQADTSADGQDVLAEPDTPDLTPIAGLFKMEHAAAAGDDILYLQLAPDGRFAWTRCYDAACSTPIRENGTWLLTRTAGGRRYLRFSQRGPAGDTASHLHSIYEYTAARAHRTIKLRRIRSARSFTLAAVDEAELCTSSKGLWQDAGRSCDCGAGWPTAYSPGAGGCWQAPAVSEADCDATSGSWTDDDPDLAGTYCDCGIGRRLTDHGCIANP